MPRADPKPSSFVQSTDEEGICNGFSQSLLGLCCIFCGQSRTPVPTRSSLCRQRVRSLRRSRAATTQGTVPRVMACGFACCGALFLQQVAKCASSTRKTSTSQKSRSRSFAAQPTPCHSRAKRRILGVGCLLEDDRLGFLLRSG